MSPILTILGFTACENNLSSIPEMPVHLQIKLLTEYPHLKNNPNQCVIFDKPRLVSDRIGYGGVLVYSDFYGDFHAFDLACPYEAQTSVKVRPDSVGNVICSKCGEVYDISLGVGMPTKGICREPLKRYVVREVNNVLYVSLR
ncbi:MAG: hypothetical protein J6P99_04750 [Paludibacteraceae bacterium]|nr:hypothetical protein [Paludibacteraceae bacterium]